MLYLQPISPLDMTERDIHWLAKMDEISYDGGTGADLLQEALRGLNRVWRICGEGLEGIAITSVKRTILQIEFLSGKGLIKNKGLLHQALLLLAKQENCTQIEGVTKSVILQSIYRSLGYSPVAVVVRMENGR